MQDRTKPTLDLGETAFRKRKFQEAKAAAAAAAAPEPMAVETEAPVLVFDHDGNLVGLGPDTPIGSVQSVFVYAKDCAA